MIIYVVLHLHFISYSQEILTTSWRSSGVDVSCVTRFHGNGCPSFLSPHIMLFSFIYFESILRDCVMQLNVCSLAQCDCVMQSLCQPTIDHPSPLEFS